MARVLKKLHSLHSKLEAPYARMQHILDRDDPALFHLAAEVSGWSVAKQLHHVASATRHMLLAVDRIANRERPSKDGGSITTTGKLVLRAGRFPRGKGKAPSKSVPPETITREDLTAALNASREGWEATLQTLELASESSWRITHPYFGDLSAAEWLRLAAVHADHHFRIIDDIDKTR